jgi:hypothetical protein
MFNSTRQEPPCARCGEGISECSCGEDRVTPDIWQVPIEVDISAAQHLMNEVSELGPKPPTHNVMDSLDHMGFVLPTCNEINVINSGLPKEAFLLLPPGVCEWHG